MYKSLVNGMVLTDEEYDELLTSEAKEIFDLHDKEDWDSFEEYLEWFKSNNTDCEFEFMEE